MTNGAKVLGILCVGAGLVLFVLAGALLAGCGDDVETGDGIRPDGGNIGVIYLPSGNNLSATDYFILQLPNGKEIECILGFANNYLDGTVLSCDWSGR